MSSSTFGGFGSSGAPGFVNPIALGGVESAAGTSLGAMANRYNQLGMSGSTPELMDLGAAPSVTGGIPLQAQATLGELVNSSLNQAPSGTGTPSALSTLGPLLGVFAK